MYYCFFFFSSRRRHTRLQGDWSSDVCSSDLDATEPLELTLKSDFGAVAKERGTEKKGQPGVLSYAATTGDSVVLDVHLRTRSEEHTSELQSPCNLVCRLLLEKKKREVVGLLAPRVQRPGV